MNAFHYDVISILGYSETRYGITTKGQTLSLGLYALRGGDYDVTTTKTRHIVCLPREREGIFQ